MDPRQRIAINDMTMGGAALLTNLLAQQGRMNPQMQQPAPMGTGQIDPQILLQHIAEILSRRRGQK